MTSNSLEAWEPTGVVEVDSAVRDWRQSSFVPAHFKDRTGAVRVADLALACGVLHDLGLSPRTNIPNVYVVGGRVQLSAELQRQLAARDGWDLEVVDESADLATVRIGRGGTWRPPVTVTMADAIKAGWTKRSARNPDQPSPYETMPARMLVARACTKAISLYAPGVKVGVAGPEEIHTGPAAAAGAAEERRDAGVGDRRRRLLKLLTAGLTDGQRHALRLAWQAEGWPPVDHPDLTAAQADAIEDTIDEITAGMDDDYDDPDDDDYDPEDPGRPFA